MQTALSTPDDPLFRERPVDSGLKLRREVV
jgi:hypothetical protein